ncbi:MAG: DUF3899 domain-containing protein [Firmicutes bacterium]|nr:DUF3899 domain-containing protein [Bacillota bacterium]
MSKAKSMLIKYGSCTAFTAAMAAVHVALNRGFAEMETVQKYRVLCDAFSIPGLLLVLFGVLVWLINQGSLDGISYAVRTGLRHLIPGGGLQQPESYWDYLEKRKQKRIRGYGFLFLAGAAALVISGVFMALFYWNR